MGRPRTKTNVEVEVDALITRLGRATLLSTLQRYLPAQGLDVAPKKRKYRRRKKKALAARLPWGQAAELKRRAAVAARKSA